MVAADASGAAVSGFTAAVKKVLGGGFTDADVARAKAQVETEPRSRELDELLHGGTVVMNYQPQFDLKSGAVRGLEALLRAKDGDGRPLNPAELIDRAERGGLIDDFGDLILMRKVGAQLAILGFEGPRAGDEALVGLLCLAAEDIGHDLVAEADAE